MDAATNTETPDPASRAPQGRLVGKAVRTALPLLACLVTLPAFGMPSVPHLPGLRDICGIQIPPARYDRGGKSVKAIDGPHYVKARQVARECRGSGEPSAVGCTTSILLGKTILAYRVLIANQPPPGTDARCTPAKWRASILRHERAHMAGWPPNHPK